MNCSEFDYSTRAPRLSLRLLLHLENIVEMLRLLLYFMRETGNFQTADFYRDLYHYEYFVSRKNISV